MMTDPRLTATQLAKALGLSRTRIGMLAAEGVVRKGKDGKYGLDAAAAYCEKLRERAEKPSNWRDLLEEEKYREKKRENDLAEDLFAPVQVLEDAVGRMAAVVVPLFESIPLNLKRAWPEITGDQIQVVKAVIAEARNAIADVELDP